MFRKGEYIIYGTRGVCEVLDIDRLDMEEIDSDRLYYTLRPLNAHESRVFTPVDNDKIVMRPLITRKEAEELISEMPEIEELSVPSEKLREQTYKDCLRTGNCREYIRIIKTLYKRKMARVAIGKKITTTDERYLKQAEDALYSEFAVLFRVKREEVPQVIDERLNGRAYA